LPKGQSIRYAPGYCAGAAATPTAAFLAEAIAELLGPIIEGRIDIRPTIDPLRERLAATTPVHPGEEQGSALGIGDLPFEARFADERLRAGDHGLGLRHQACSRVYR
jgi:hypothetical protein